MLLGLLLGSIPFAVPGISLPVKLGLAGGPIILGILIGTFGPRIHIVTYTTLSANLMLRALGLSLYLACLGLEAGAHFVETIMRPEGMLWIGLGFLLTFVPIVIVAALSLRFFKLDFGQVAGIMCGSMANPMALNYANDSIPGDHPAVAYATVYPVMHVPAGHHHSDSDHVLYLAVAGRQTALRSEEAQRTEPGTQRPTSGSSATRRISPSKLGVKIPPPTPSAISRSVQKRPPSNSPLGTTGPSYTVL